MADALVVEVHERLEQPARHLARPLLRVGPVLAHAVEDLAAVQLLHHQEQRVVRLDHLVQPDYVRMVDFAHELHLAPHHHQIHRS